MYHFASFDVNSDVDWDSAFDTSQVGRGFDRGQHYIANPGSLYQRGGSPFTQLLGRLFLNALPLLKRAGGAIAKEALATSSNIASDVALGGEFVDSLKRNSSLGYRNLVDKAAAKLVQRGGRVRKSTKSSTTRKNGKNKKSKRKIKKVRKTIRKKKTSVKKKSIKKKSRDIFGHFNGN